jgi:hypothetical protein
MSPFGTGGCLRFVVTASRTPPGIFKEACLDHRQGYDQAAERKELALLGLAADGVVYSCSA